jgi:hypothetical protein
MKMLGDLFQMRTEIRVIGEAFQVATAAELAPDSGNQDYPSPTLDASFRRSFEFLSKDEIDGVGRVRTNQTDPGHAFVNRDGESSVAHRRVATRLNERPAAVEMSCLVETVNA